METKHVEGPINKEAADMLAAAICRGRLWGTEAETAEWLKTESGQGIAALIEKERDRIRDNTVHEM